MRLVHILNRSIFEDRFSNDCFVDYMGVREGKVAIISILPPDLSNMHVFKDASNVLNLDILDNDESISLEDASKIVEFIENNLDKVFYIHCEAGLSRSQAIGRFLIDNYDYIAAADTRLTPYPNGQIIGMLNRILWERYLRTNQIHFS